MTTEQFEEIFDLNLDLSIDYTKEELRRDILIAMHQVEKEANEQLIELLENWIIEAVLRAKQSKKDGFRDEESLFIGEAEAYCNVKKLIESNNQEGEK